MADKFKIDDLKTKIKTLQNQIEEKNQILKTVKTSQPQVQQKIKILNGITETKVKNLNYSMHALKKENEILRKSPEKNNKYNQSVTVPLEEEEQKYNSLLPIIKEKRPKHTRQKSDEARMNYNKELITKMNNSPLMNKGNYNLVSNDYEFSSLIRQLDALKTENLHLKKKVKDSTLRYSKEIDIRSKEIEEMSDIRNDYAELTERFDELKKLLKIKNLNNDNINEIVMDSEEGLGEQIKELEKKYSGQIYENERLRQNLKTIKLKVKYMLLEKKKYLQMRISMRNDNCCQYSMAFEEESKNLATNEEEHQDLQEINKEINEAQQKLLEEVDDKNCEVNQEELEIEQKNEDLLQEEALIDNNEQLINEEQIVENANLDEKNLATFGNDDGNQAKTNLKKNVDPLLMKNQVEKDQKRRTFQNMPNNSLLKEVENDHKRKTMGDFQLISKKTQNSTDVIMQEKNQDAQNHNIMPEQNQQHIEEKTENQISQQKVNNVEEEKNLETNILGQEQKQTENTLHQVIENKNDPASIEKTNNSEKKKRSLQNMTANLLIKDVEKDYKNKTHGDFQFSHKKLINATNDCEEEKNLEQTEIEQEQEEKKTDNTIDETIKKQNDEASIKNDIKNKNKSDKKKRSFQNMPANSLLKEAENNNKRNTVQDFQFSSKKKEIKMDHNDEDQHIITEKKEVNEVENLDQKDDEEVNKDENLVKDQKKASFSHDQSKRRSHEINELNNSQTKINPDINGVNQTNIMNENQKRLSNLNEIKGQNILEDKKKSTQINEITQEHAALLNKENKKDSNDSGEKQKRASKVNETVEMKKRESKVPDINDNPKQGKLEDNNKRKSKITEIKPLEEETQKRASKVNEAFEVKKRESKVPDIIDHPNQGKKEDNNKRASKIAEIEPLEKKENNIDIQNKSNKNDNLNEKDQIINIDKNKRSSQINDTRVNKHKENDDTNKRDSKIEVKDNNLIQKEDNNNEFIDEVPKKIQEKAIIENEKKIVNSNNINQIKKGSLPGGDSNLNKQIQNQRYRHSVNDSNIENRKFKSEETKENEKNKVKDDLSLLKNNKNTSNNNKEGFDLKIGSITKNQPEHLAEINEETEHITKEKDRYLIENENDNLNQISVIDPENNEKPEDKGFVQLPPSHQQNKTASTTSLTRYSIKVNSTKPLVIFVLGGPGSGKGTQCTKIKEKFQFEHLSTGDLLRDELKYNSEYAKIIDPIIKEGKLVPSEILLKILKKTIINTSYINMRILLDGFPRNLENLTKWDEIIGDACEVSFLLFFECSAEILEKRILDRAKTSGRSDDNLESFKKRIKTYEDETKPLLEMFETKGQILRINSENPVEEVFEEVEKLFKDFGF